MAQQLPSLSTNGVDWAVVAAKGGLGAIPFVGPLAAELVGSIIPSQRMDRIVRFLELLEQRVKDFEKSKLDGRKNDSRFVDIMEDAFFQASRAVSEDRLIHLVNVVANGLSPEEIDQAETKRMLWLLSQLTDTEVVILRGKLPDTNEAYDADADFQAKHADVLAPDDTHLGSSEEELEEQALRSSYRQHLHDLGLLRQRFSRPRRGELPEFDERTGMMKARGYDVTRLGRMFLRYLDLIPAWYQR